jgi:hypothetical protein
MQKLVTVIIPTWNGAADLAEAIDSVLAQTYEDFVLIIVDNGSTDNSRQLIEDYGVKDRRIQAIYNDRNYGYTGGVNPGIAAAFQNGSTYVAPFNNDARADKNWLRQLVGFLDTNPTFGIAACALLHADGKTIDSTADQYTIWGLPFPRDRGQPVDRMSHQTTIFGASGGASMYRVSMLRHIGSFDPDFFAYYEDIDLSFRAQLAGWKVAFVPAAVVYHEQGKTSKRFNTRSAAVSPFLTKQFMKNLPFIIVKDVPARLLLRVGPRFVLAYILLLGRAIVDGRGGAALAGIGLFWLALPKKLAQRYRIQKQRAVSTSYLWNILVHDLPPDAHKLRALRARWWKLRGRA